MAFITKKEQRENREQRIAFAVEQLGTMAPRTQVVSAIVDKFGVSERTAHRDCNKAVGRCYVGPSERQRIRVRVTRHLEAAGRMAHGRERPLEMVAVAKALADLYRLQIDATELLADDRLRRETVKAFIAQMSDLDEGLMDDLETAIRHERSRRSVRELPGPLLGYLEKALVSRHHGPTIEPSPEPH